LFSKRHDGLLTVRFLLDTNILSDLVRHPHGCISDRIKRVGEEQVCTSIIVAAEIRYGAERRGSLQLTRQLEAVLSALDVLRLETQVDIVYGKLRARLKRAGQPIGGNDLLLAAHALALDHTLVTDNEREFSQVKDLTIENWLR
jgi:tRNA(fMet)-specific endonuclease VapC